MDQLTPVPWGTSHATPLNDLAVLQGYARPYGVALNILPIAVATWWKLRVWYEAPRNTRRHQRRNKVWRHK